MEQHQREHHQRKIGNADMCGINLVGYLVDMKILETDQQQTDKKDGVEESLNIGK